ncbi:MAG: response regulator transcription factor [Ruminococcus sp.]|nr:response regulator transcription factor [Ruminococcus sp.]
MAFRILTVEDSAQIREMIGDYFSAKGKDVFTVDFAPDGNTGLAMLYENEYDLVLLDIMLPGASGFEICRTVRSGSAVPIIFMTALGSESDILRGYDLGADDYIVKPFSLAALYAKCLALVKRAKGMVQRGEVITCGGIGLDPVKMTVTVNGETVETAPKEYFLLKLLMDNKERVLSREAIITKVWSYDFDGDERVVDNHIKKLRKALGSESKRIKTVFGGGYKLTEN